ncbi:hypothetical protein TUBRATIS_28360 [Tubulinosema ratisbonensis]|uniref:Uncharacterized protein n=1 Tax=Tubulinosema ratisbonensis TaxID=291195 RepID=A0A437AHV0_9MICR|nr:hypothetical protein TUBRATIS_28360 [Tubulinosema ratisbonensis]
MFIDNAINNVQEINQKLKKLHHFEPLPEQKQKRIPYFASNKQYHSLIEILLPEVQLVVEEIEDSQKDYFVNGDPKEIMEERINSIDQRLSEIQKNNSITELRESIEKEEFLLKISELKDSNKVNELSSEEIKSILQEFKPVICDEDIQQFVDDKMLNGIKYFTDERVSLFESILNYLSKRKD